MLVENVTMRQQTQIEWQRAKDTALQEAARSTWANQYHCDKIIELTSPLIQP